MVNLNKICWLWIWNKAKRKAYQKRQCYLNRFGARYINDKQFGNDVILHELQKNKPCLITRFGSTEFRIVDFFYTHMKCKNIVFPKKYKKDMKLLAGFFSNSDELLVKYACDVLQILRNVDVFAPWMHRVTKRNEPIIFDEYNQNAKLVSLESLGPDLFFVKNPWTQYLKGKKVLIIHPFEKSIQSQYKKRHLLFGDKEILPDFKLITIKTVQGLGDSEEIKNFENWYEALESMYKKIDAADFDIALVSGGAYGMFLANYIKEKGKQVVHVAGALQILFGIKGQRWENNQIAPFINEHWVYPLDEETPKNLGEFAKTEGFNAYWK